MEFAKSRSDVIRSVQQQWLLSYWTRLCGTEPLPASRKLVVEELARLTDSLMFCDVETEAGHLRFRIRYQGARILETYGKCDGIFLEDTLPPVSREATLAAYRTAVDERRPVYTVAETHDRAGKPVDFERLLLPFSRDGGNVNRIMSALAWVSTEGGFDSRELLKLQPTAPRYSVRATITA